MPSIFDLLGIGKRGEAPISTPPIYNPNQNQPMGVPENVDPTPIVADQPVHKGMFGIKGTLRDILGAVGDFKANQEGRMGRYENLRNREQIGDAMRGYDQDPLKAIRQVFKVDPKTGQDMLSDYKDQQAKAQIAREKRIEMGRGLVQGMLGTIKDEKTYAKMAPLLRQTAQRYEVPADEIDPFLGSTYDPDLIAAYRYGGFPVDKQVAAEETARYHDLMDDNYDERTDITRRGTEARIAQGNARVAQGATRTDAYVRNTNNQIERRNNPVARPSSKSSKTTTPRPAGVTPPTPPKGYTWKKKGS